MEVYKAKAPMQVGFLVDAILINFIARDHAKGIVERLTAIEENGDFEVFTNFIMGYTCDQLTREDLDESQIQAVRVQMVALTSFMRRLIETAKEYKAGVHPLSQPVDSDPAPNDSI